MLAVDPTGSPERAGQRRTRKRPRLLYVTGCWSFFYAALLAGCAALGTSDALFGQGAVARVADALLIALCLVLAITARQLADTSERRSPSRWRIGVLWGASGVLVVAVPTNLLMQVAFAAVRSRLGLVLHVLALAGGLLWATVTLHVQRSAGRGCSRCGRTSNLLEADGWVRPPAAVRRVAVAAAGVPLLGFTLPHWLWAAGVFVGTREVAALREVRGALWLLGAVPAAGALLTVGLVRRWGQVFPAHWPVLGGRPVWRWCATVPALLVAVMLLQYGVMMTGCAGATLLGMTARCYTADRTYLLENWAFTATYPVFLCWGLLLGAAGLGYRSMTRRRCDSCGRR